jgi:large subunit ribosomal protein L25
MKLELRTNKLSEVRKANYIPGVMYGRSIESLSIQTEKPEFFEALKTYGKNKTFKVRVDSKYHHVYIKDVQSNVLHPNDIIHFSLHRVTPKESMIMEIPVNLLGKEVFFNDTLFPELVLSEISAEYIAGSGISSFDLDVSKLKLGDEIKIKDLVVPKGVTIKHDLDQTIVVIKEVRLAAEEEKTVDKVIVEDPLMHLANNL